MHSRRLPSCLVLGLTLAVLTGPVHGQKPIVSKRTFEESAAYRSSRILRNQLRKTEIAPDPKDKDHQEAVNIMAQDSVYPVYWITESGSFTPRELSTAVEAFASQLNYLHRDKTGTLQQMFCRRAIDCCMDIAQTSKKPVAKINVAIMLLRVGERPTDRKGIPLSEKEWADSLAHRLSEGNAEHLASSCLALLQQQLKDDKDPRLLNDGYKYYLFQALSSVLGVPVKSPPKPATAEKIIQAALDFLATKRAFAKNAPREEREGYKVLRREAIKVIARAPSATLGKAQPALVLARFAGNDERISPPPRLDERTEAAVGLARLLADPAKSPGLQPDYAAVQVARAVQGFAIAANANIEKTKLERTRPWMVEAARLNEAIDKMKGDGKNKYLTDVVKQCQSILSHVEQGSSKAPANELSEWIERNAPAAKSVYARDEDSTVKAIPEKEE